MEPIEIRIHQWDERGELRCDEECAFFVDDDGLDRSCCNRGLDAPNACPGPRCPGPGVYTLTRKEKSDGSD